MNLMPSTLRQGRAVLDAAPEAVRDLPFVKPVDGQALTLGIRPEDFVVAHDPVRGGLPVTVELIEELGGSRVAYCALAEQQLAVVLPKSFHVIDGSALYLTFPENALHGFDAISGKRLAKAVVERPRLVPA